MEVSEHTQKTFGSLRDELTRRGVPVPEACFTRDSTIDLSWGEYGVTGSLLLLNISDECVCFYGDSIPRVGAKATLVCRDGNATVESLCAALTTLKLIPEKMDEQ